MAERGELLKVLPDSELSEAPMVQLVGELHSRSFHVLETLRHQANKSALGGRQAPLFRTAQAASLVGRSSAAIREAEKDVRLLAKTQAVPSHRPAYTLAEINALREVFGTRPWREVGDPCATIAVQNFKGGVGKSTLATHLAQYLAIRGYRVCLIDCDSQGSSSALFGHVPDMDFSEDETLYPFFRNAEMTSLEYAVRPSHWDGLFLIPANLRLYSSEYELAARVAQQGPHLLDRLAQGVASISDHFDVIILDPPPALGTISLSVMRAANALLVPVPPTVVDLSSTSSFLAMLHETLQIMEEHYAPLDFSWVRLVATKADEQKSMQREMLNLMRNLFGENMLQSIIKDSAEIDNASARLMTVYELEQPVTSRETYQRCITFLNAVNAEIETQILKTWPSRAGKLNGQDAN